VPTTPAPWFKLARDVVLGCAALRPCGGSRAGPDATEDVQPVAGCAELVAGMGQHQLLAADAGGVGGVEEHRLREQGPVVSH
jgi:hypothetical protein